MGCLHACVCGECVCVCVCVCARSMDSGDFALGGWTVAVVALTIVVQKLVVGARHWFERTTTTTWQQSAKTTTGLSGTAGHLRGLGYNVSRTMGTGTYYLSTRITATLGRVRILSLWRKATNHIKFLLKKRNEWHRLGIFLQCTYVQGIVKGTVREQGKLTRTHNADTGKRISKAALREAYRYITNRRARSYPPPLQSRPEGPVTTLRRRHDGFYV